MTALAGWESFYVIVGSSAGALIGLQFVVITLIADRCSGQWPPGEIASERTHPTQTQATESDLVLEFSKQRPPLSFVDAAPPSAPDPGTSPSWLTHVDGKKPERSTGAPRFLRARATFLAGSDIGKGAVPIIPATIVELLTAGQR
jgi:hypothetical protein